MDCQHGKYLSRRVHHKTKRNDMYDDCTRWKQNCTVQISLKSHVCLSFSVINPVEWKEIQRFTSLNHHFITLLLTGKDEERPVSSQMQMERKLLRDLRGP